MPRDLLTAPITDLEVGDVEAFLALEESSDEGITWEAKADHPTDPLRNGVIEKAACAFANSDLGGVIIVGVAWDESTRRWGAPGLVHPAPNIRNWLDQAVTKLRPTPTHEIGRELKGERGPVVVVRVRPLDLPPAITSSGHVYTRTGTQSLPITDPALLARLFDKGARARRRAVEAAERAVGVPMDPSCFVGLTSATQGCVLILSPVVAPHALAGPIYRRSFGNTVARALESRFPGALGDPAISRVRGDGMFAIHDIGPARYVVDALLDGPVRINVLADRALSRFEGAQIVREDFDGLLDLGGEIVAALEAAAPTFVLSYVWTAGSTAKLEMWSETQLLSGGVREVARRQLLRGLGYSEAFEPE